MFYKFVLLICLIGLLAACGGASTDIAQEVAQNVAQIESVNVEATVISPVITAVSETTAAASTPVPPPATEAAIVPPTEAEPTEPVPIAVDTVAPATAVPEPSTCVTKQSVNIRTGPGVSYEPAIRTLPSAETLIPLAFQPSGFPDGQWVQVQVASTGEVGWVSAGSQFISCNFSVTSLPPATNIQPPPPTKPAPLNAPPSGSVFRPNVRESVTGGEIDLDPLLDFQHQYSNAFLLRLDIKNNHDQSDADINGRGISKVTFQVSYEATGVPVYTHEEGTAGYCIFRGGEPDCRPWPQNANGRYTWGEGGAEVEPGTYKINVFIYPKDSESAEWFWGSIFTISP